MAANQAVYLDNHATTPTDPRVVEAMLPYFTEVFGNPASSHHVIGWKAEEAVEDARERIASAIGAKSREIAFTSGATESNNLAIKGVAARAAPDKKHIVTVATEHKAVLDPCAGLDREGFRVTYLPVDESGLVDLDQLGESITEETCLVSVMYANNEIGVIQPISEIGALCRERGVTFHCDATQALGKLPIDVEEEQIDLLSLSAHKIYGPKGIGALFVRRRRPRVRLLPLLEGGGHERGLRAGTLNVPGIAGFGRAVELCREEMDSERGRLAGLRDKLRKRLFAELEDVRENGHPDRKLANNLNVSFAYVDARSLMNRMEDVIVSSGSACTSQNPEPSHVLLALGLPEDLAHGTIRFGLGRFTTAEQVDYAAERVIHCVRELRQLSPLSG